VPFRRRHHHPDLASEQQRIVGPLAKVEERLMDLGTDLDTLAADVSDVALRMRQMAQQIASQAGGPGND
jgi:hypothetical protein